MPEGDTVWRTAQHLHQALSGHVLTASDFRVPALATVDLAGLQVSETVSRGKHLLTRISGVPVGRGTDRNGAGGSGSGANPAAAPMTLHTHLKMEGSWHLYREGTAWRRPAHEARVVLRTAEWTAVGFALGVVEVLPTAEESRVVGHLGPDLLGPGWDLDEAVRRVAAEPHRPVAAAILDQRNVAGLGNLYKSELCFLLGLHPETPVADVPDVRALVQRGKQLLEANKLRTAQTTTGDTRRGRQHWVYRRDGQPCRRCGTPIEVAMQGPAEAGAGAGAGAGWPSAQAGRERASYWCPHCQPAR